jgi:RNA polymerase sigma-70 factor (ECF subfamily)
MQPASHARLDLERAMAHLSPPERATLTLCYAMEFSNTEAADILEMPVGTVKSHVLRGREKLKALLEATA